MLCPQCQQPAGKFGRNRNGSQRFRCATCNITWTDRTTRPADRRQLAEEKAIQCLRMLLEGNSVRSTERLTDIHRDTIIATMIRAGQACERFMERTVRLLS